MECVVGAAARGHVLPDEHAQPVAERIEARLLHFEVHAQQVEAKFAHRADVKLERLLRRWRHEAVRPVALVEHATQEDGRAVQVDARHTLPVGTNLDRAKGTVAAHAVRIEGELQVVEVRVARTPEPWSLDGQHELHVLLSPHEGGGTGHLPTVVHKARDKLARTLDTDEKGHTPLVRAGVHAQLHHMRRRHDLEPGITPDAALGRIPYAAAGAALLSAQLRPGVGRVEDADGELVLLARAHRIRNVSREGQVGPRVLGDAHPVDVDAACPVDGIKMQDQALARVKGWRVELAAIPQQLVRPELAANAGKRRLGREGHADGLPSVLGRHGGAP